MVAEIGTDMSRFPSRKHPTSWAGVCRGNMQSAGKRPGRRTGKGNVWLRAMLALIWSRPDFMARR
ncbi:MAG: transposase [Chloroflexi bacterium]|nr:transposase [Chloroflexota bacterium]MBV9596830.1 transposase [Chloroflexota bacterium]